MPKKTNIPTVTDLVAAGDPKLKTKAQEMHSKPQHINELNMRIDELESAIGQNNSGPIGRAFAIRAETSGHINQKI